MELRIRVREGDVTHELRRRIGRRVRLALGRHAPRIAAVRVTLAQPAAGSADGLARCTVRVRLRAGAALEIEERGEELHAVAARAAWRLEHRLDRQRELRASRPSVA